MHFRFVCAAVACGFFLSSCGSRTQGTSPSVYLSGAGSTSDGILFAKAFAAYSHATPGVKVDYEPVGSGAGIDRFTRRSVDFGASDVPMNARELAAYPGGANHVEQLPITLGGVVLAYHIPGLNDEFIPHRVYLRLTPDAAAGIFLGKIKMWNDPVIAASNPNVRLPAMVITVVHREDSCGPTYLLTDYLSAVSPEWKSQEGRGKTVAWKTAAFPNAKSDRAIDAEIRRKPGAIGYVELAYALAEKMNYAAIRNRSGEYVLPSMSSVEAAAKTQAAISPTAFSIVDQPGLNAYPIAGYSWLLLERKSHDDAKGAALCKFARWMLSDGQKFAPSVDYVPLPDGVSKSALAALGPCPAN